MKDNLIHLCFVIDESGSMSGSEGDILGGFKNLIDEQLKVEDGDCLVSVYRFNTVVSKDFIGKNVRQIETLSYSPGGLTAMNDGIGTAIDEIGAWLSSMPEDERPSKNMIVIMTDGYENASREYDLSKVQKMIKHQKDKYNWSFVFLGSDITDLKDADNLGVGMRSVSGKANIINNYGHINAYASKLRLAKDYSDIMGAEMELCSSLTADTALYMNDKGASNQ